MKGRSSVNSRTRARILDSAMLIVDDDKGHYLGPDLSKSFKMTQYEGQLNKEFFEANKEIILSCKLDKSQKDWDEKEVTENQYSSGGEKEKDEPDEIEERDDEEEETGEDEHLETEQLPNFFPEIQQPLSPLS